MSPDHILIIGAALAVVIGGPIVLGGMGIMQSRKAPFATTPALAWDWQWTIHSTLAYVLAFNLIFFVQELFLVLPKAFTPGLRPILFHNNHDWTGDNPLAELFQGTGALAIFIVATACTWWLSARPPRSLELRLLVLWLAFSGFFQSLPQVVVGSVVARNDVGRAMNYLGFLPDTKAVAALLALGAIAVLSISFTRPFLELARDRAEIETPARRAGFIFRIAMLPAIAGTLLVIPFRIPGSIDQVAIVPVAVLIIGASWIQAGAWGLRPTKVGVIERKGSLYIPLAAMLVVLAIFQLVLRPGIPFFRS
jgi:hypothetical protein